MRTLCLLLFSAVVGFVEAAKVVSESSLSRALERQKSLVAAGSGRAKKRKRVSAAVLAHGAFAPPSAASLNIQRKADALQGLSQDLDIADEEDVLEAGREARRKSFGRGQRVSGGVPAFGASAGAPAPSAFAETSDLDAFVSRPSVLPGPSCLVTDLKCDLSAKFRTVDGRCNNLKHPEFGSASSPYRRLAEPAYDDKIGAPRTKGAKGEPLPSPRTVSVAIHETKDRPDAQHSHMVMQWGQFLDHDITLTPQARATVGGGWSGQPRQLGVQDCSTCPGDVDDDDLIRPLNRRNSRSGGPRRPAFPVCRGKRDVALARSGLIAPCRPFPVPRPDLSNICFPIPVPEDDQVFEPGTCMHFVRSAAGQLSLGARQQMNQITSFIDASNVYGSDLVTSEGLRSKKGGRLAESSSGTLPQKHEPACQRAAVAKGHRCFKAGDVRCNVQPALMSIHTLWLKQHNRLAEELAKLNPHWESDERLYQEARRIVAAQHQHITYNEFLPLVLGPDFMQRYGLRAQTKGKYYAYDRDCDATIYNEFATAAFRFGHSLINDALRRPGRSDLNLTGHFMDPSQVLGKRPMRKVQTLLQGLMEQPAQKVDRFVANAMRNNLFGSEEELGMDIVALNIQRGRDHGLQPYHRYRAVYGLSKVESWADLEALMTKATVARFRKAYASPLDVDLYSGMLAEPAVEGGLVGELCAHVLAAQFHRLRDCDRFYYENGRQTGSFSRRQLDSLRKTTLAKVVCDYADSPATVPAQAFRVDGKGKLECRPGQALTSLDLSAWKEKPRSSRRSSRTKRKKEKRIKIRPRCFVEPDINIAT